MGHFTETRNSIIRKSWKVIFFLTNLKLVKCSMSGTVLSTAGEQKDKYCTVHVLKRLTVGGRASGECW